MKDKTNKILILGGSGFIGSELRKQLKSNKTQEIESVDKKEIDLSENEVPKK